MSSLHTEAKRSDETIPDFPPKPTLVAVTAAFVCSMCFMLQFGYSIGTLNAAAEPIRRFYNQSHFIRYGAPMKQSDLDLLWTFSLTAFPLGGALGSVLVAPLMTRFGQKKSLLLSQVFCITGVLLLSLSSVMHSYEAIVIGEFLVGMYCAVGLGIGPSYVSDVTIPRLRGPFGGLFGSSIAIGLIFGNLFALKQILGSDNGWPYLLAITLVPNIVFLIYYKWMPESPRSLYLISKNEKKAEMLLRILQGSTRIQDEINEYEAEKETQGETLSTCQVLASSSNRLQVLSAIVVLGSVQLTGINGVLYNLNNIFIVAGVEEQYATYVSIGVSVFQLVVVVIAGLVSGKYGRKRLFFLGNGCIVLSIIVYTLSLAFQQRATWLSYVAIVGTLGFVAGLNGGSGLVAYVIAPEVLNQSSRPAGMAVGGFVFWISFAAVSFATPYMFAALDYGALLPYLGIAILLIIYVYFFVPETKGMTSSEVESYYARRNKVCSCGASEDNEIDFGYDIAHL